MKTAVYGFLFGFLALFGVATVVPALAQNNDVGSFDGSFNSGNQID
jgi:hypothetical protein